MFADPAAVLDRVRGGFRAARILVVGDAMLDRYLWGEVSRISPEAPVPVVRLTRRSAVAGGAANVAANLAALGCRARLVAAVGDDGARGELAGLLAGQGIADGLVAVPRFPTIVKTRVLGGHQQMVRIDEEEPRALDDAAREPLIAAAVAAVADSDAVILSDYAKGVLAGRTAPAIIAAARAKGIPVLVDPKGTAWDRYRDATTITPNTGELAAVAGIPANDHDGLLAAGRGLRERLGLQALTFTRGEHGISLIAADRTVSVPAQAREVFDVSGAGDTVIATMAAGLAAGLGLEDAMRLANTAAGIVVGKVGTVPIHGAELEAELVRLGGGEPAGKVLERAACARQVAAWRAAGEQVVFTNGCFDILHAGHIQALETARRQGDRLVVGLNSDDSVRRLKGPARPVNGGDDRATVLAALSCVDAVVEFGEDTPLDLICAVKPTVLVKGADYREDQVVGGAEVKSWGGKVVLVPLLPGRSTTATIERAKG